MAVRNFYVAGKIDGRASMIGAGPARKDGGMSATISVRHDGEIVNVARLAAFALADGRLVLEITTTREGMELYAPEFSDRPMLRFESRR